MPKCDFNNVALHLWVAASIYWEIFAKLLLWLLWLHELDKIENVSLFWKLNNGTQFNFMRQNEPVQSCILNKINPNLVSNSIIILFSIRPQTDRIMLERKSINILLQLFYYNLSLYYICHRIFLIFLIYNRLTCNKQKVGLFLGKIQGLSCCFDGYISLQ